MHRNKRELQRLLSLEAGHETEVEDPSPLICFVCPQSSWGELSLETNVSVSSVRADSSFQVAVVPSPHMWPV